MSWGGVPYGQEQRTVWVVRLVTHLTGCIMIYAGPAKHPFLVSNRRWLVLSFLFIAFVAVVEEGRAVFQSDYLDMLCQISYKVGESCLAFIVLSGCFLIHAVLQKQDYRLTNAFYLALGLYALALLTNNTIKIGYLANAVVSAVSFSVMRDFRRAHEGGADAQASTVESVLRLEAILVVLNGVCFCVSFLYNIFGMKAAIYVLYIFRITLVYLFVRPYLGEGELPTPELLALM